MAFVRCSGGRAKKNIIYKDGVWRFGYLNPGSYAYSNASSPWALQPDKLYAAYSIGNIIGTATAIDVSNFNVLHIKAKAIQGVNATAFISTQAAYTSGFIRNCTINTTGLVVDYAIDVSDQTAVYIGLISTDTQETEVYEIYLT